MVHCDEFLGPIGGEQFQLAFSLQESLVDGTFTTVMDYPVDVAGHMWPAELTSFSIVHATPARVFCQFRIRSQSEEAWPKQVWYRSLVGIID